MSSNGAAPTIVRKNHGRGHSYTVNGAKLPGATTVLSKGYPKHLEKWAADKAAEYAVDNWAELAEVGTSQKLKRIAEARFADRDAAAGRGTKVHALASRLAAGEADVPVPDELEGHVDAYLAFADDWQPREVLLEATVANVRWGYCGTLDVVADMAGERWLLDLKTTRSGIFAESALQLAAYRYAEWVVDASGVVVPMLPVDRCAAVWLKGDRTYELTPVDATPETFRVFLYALEVMRFAERDDVVLAPLEVPAHA